MRTWEYPDYFWFDLFIRMRTVVLLARTNQCGPLVTRCVLLADLVSSLGNHSCKVHQPEQGEQVHNVVENEHLYLLSLLDMSRMYGLFLKRRYAGELHLAPTMPPAAA
jgi:hypothetical protein